MEKCPYCNELILGKAVVCRFCGHGLARESSTDDKWKELSQRFRAADHTTQGKLWADLDDGQRRYLRTNFGLSWPSAQAPLIAEQPPPVQKKTFGPWSYVGPTFIGLFLLSIPMAVLDPEAFSRPLSSERKRVTESAGVDGGSGYASEAHVMCRGFVEDRLASPGSADHPTLVQISHKRGRVDLVRFG